MRLNRITNRPARWFRQDPPPSNGDGTSGTQDPPPASGQGDAAQGTGTTPPPQGGQGAGQEAKETGSQEPTVPKSRLDEVLRERDALAADKAARERKEKEDQGKYQELADAEKARADGAVSAAQTMARRQALTEALIGQKVTNVNVALRLAIADGLLETIPVDKDYTADQTKAVEVVKKLLEDKEYEAAINPPSRSFGDDASGRNGGPAPKDPSKMSAVELLSAGFKEGAKR